MWQCKAIPYYLSELPFCTTRKLAINIQLSAKRVKMSNQQSTRAKYSSHSSRPPLHQAVERATEVYRRRLMVRQCTFHLPQSSCMIARNTSLTLWATVQPVNKGTDAETAMAVMRLIESGVDTSIASKIVLGQDLTIEKTEGEASEWGRRGSTFVTNLCSIIVALL